jgi:hypothetical protein
VGEAGLICEARVAGTGSEGVGAEEPTARELGRRLHALLSGAARSVLVSNVPASSLERELRHCAMREAASKLAQQEPQFSALTVISDGQRRFFLVLLIATVAMLLCLPRLFGLLATIFIALGYLSNAVFRAWLFWVGAEQSEAEEVSPSNRRALPIYTVLVPLYREANMLPQLGVALRSLNYPGIR